MLKTIVILLVGLSIGYWYGFSDAQVHKDNLAVRVVHSIGGENRNKVRNDTDRQMDSVEAR